MLISLVGAFLCLAAATALLLAVFPASGSPNSPASGTLRVSAITITSTLTADGTVTLVVYAEGTTSARGEGTCAYTVDGISSTLPYQFVVSGTSSPPPQPGWPTRPNAPLRQLPGRDHDGQLHLS